MNKLSEKSGVFLLLITLGVIFIILSFLSDGSAGGADSYVHYRMAHYAFKYPYYFLDHWGKPLFTILSSPMAQFGYNGSKLFNVFIGLLTAYFSYLIVKTLNYKNSFLAIVFVCFSPLFLIMLFTSMTEILFAFVLVLSVYLFFTRKYISSAIVISFLPFARTEGFLILPLFMLVSLLHKNFKVLPFFFLGFVFFSIVGGFYFHDFLWVINNNPYTPGTGGIYGSGPLFYFISSYKEILGIPLTILFLCGVGVLIFRKGPRDELMLIFLPLFVYLAFHSLIWWKGLGALGLTRIMVGVTPLAGILSLKGLNLFDQWFSVNKWIKVTVLTVVAGLVIKAPFNTFVIPFPLSEPEALVKETSEWLKTTNYYKNKIYSFDPLFCHFLDIDPGDTSRIHEMYFNTERPEEGILDGGIMLWDAHFGPNEGRIPLNKLLENPNFKLIKLFSPKAPFAVLGGYNYEIYAFQKGNFGLSTKNKEIYGHVDYEEYENKALLSNTFSHSGHNSFKLDSITPCLPAIVAKLSELTARKGIMKIICSAFFYPIYDVRQNPSSLIVSFEHDGKSYDYNAFGFDNMEVKLNAWNKISIEKKLPLPQTPNDIIKVYVLHNGKKEIYIDDLQLEIMEIK
jgi:hypothetical protein